MARHCWLFEIHSDTKKKSSILMSKPTESLWALFGFQTTFGLTRWILRREARVQKKAIGDFATALLSSAVERWEPKTMLPKVPSTKIKKMNMSAKTGYISRLCTDHDSDGLGVVAMLRHAIQKNTTEPANVDQHLSVLRAFVPLLHNEAYQIAPHGIGQANFVLATNYDYAGTQGLDNLYWKVMGRRMVRRLSVSTVPCP